MFILAAIGKTLRYEVASIIGSAATGTIIFFKQVIAKKKKLGDDKKKSSVKFLEIAYSLEKII